MILERSGGRGKGSDMDTLNQIADDLNTIGRFLAKRNIATLTADELKLKYGVRQADLLILFGGIIPYGCELTGQGFIDGIAKQMMIVGGEGHTTAYFRKVIHERYPQIPVNGRMEADIIADYLRMKYGIANCLIERHSTNCGNNAEFALDIVRTNNVACQTVIIIHDSSMQRRMDATMRKVWKDQGSTIINYAPYLATVVERDRQLAFRDPDLWGMWTMDHYITLLLGEIPRLSDDADGYGPRGKNFIAHVDIADAVIAAFQRMKETHGSYIRKPLS